MTCQNLPFWAPGGVSSSCHDNFCDRLPSKLLVVAQWNLVCSFVMVIPRDVLKDFSKFWIFLIFAVFSKKTDRNNFWFRLPSIISVVAQWNLVCSFVMVIPRDILKDFSKFLNFFDFCCFSKKIIERIFDSAYRLNYWSYPNEIWYAASLW